MDVLISFSTRFVKGRLHRNQTPPRPSLRPFLTFSRPSSSRLSPNSYFLSFLPSIFLFLYPLSFSPSPLPFFSLSSHLPFFVFLPYSLSFSFFPLLSPDSIFHFSFLFLSPSPFTQFPSPCGLSRPFSIPRFHCIDRKQAPTLQAPESYYLFLTPYVFSFMRLLPLLLSLAFRFLFLSPVIIVTTMVIEYNMLVIKSRLCGLLISEQGHGHSLVSNMFLACFEQLTGLGGWVAVSYFPFLLWGGGGGYGVMDFARFVVAFMQCDICKVTRTQVIIRILYYYGRVVQKINYLLTL